MPIKETIADVTAVTMAKRAAPDIALERWQIVADSITITSDSQYQAAAQNLLQIKEATETWTSYWKPFVDSAKKLYDLLRNEQNGPIKKLAELREIIEARMSDFKNQQIAEARRLSAAMEEQQRDLRRDLETQALNLHRQGRVTEANLLQAQAEIQPTQPLFQYAAPKTVGVAEVTDWEITIEDPLALCRALADGSVPLKHTVMGKEVSLVEFRLSAIKEAAKSQGAAFNWPGVRVEQKTSYRVSSGL